MTIDLEERELSIIVWALMHYASSPRQERPRHCQSNKELQHLAVRVLKSAADDAYKKAGV